MNLIARQFFPTFCISLIFGSPSYIDYGMGRMFIDVFVAKFINRRKYQSC